VPRIFRRTFKTRKMDMEIEKDFVFQGLPPIETQALTNPLGSLQLLPGKWTGHGFCRPFWEIGSSCNK
jgi:hypothetical protein